MFEIVEDHTVTAAHILFGLRKCLFMNSEIIIYNVFIRSIEVLSGTSRDEGFGGDAEQPGDILVLPREPQAPANILGSFLLLP